MPRIALAVSALLLLATAAPAGAKGVGEITVCARDGCTDVTEQATHAVLEGGTPTLRKTRLTDSHFRVRVSIEAGTKVLDTWELRWYPGRRLLLGDDGMWMRPSPAAESELELLTAGREPLGSPPVADGGDGGGAPTALAIGGPAGVVALGAAVLLTRRRRRR